MARIDQLLETMRTYSPQQCLDGDGGSHTYADLLDEIDLWGERLNGFGVEPGTVVGVRADYSLSSIAAILALLSRRAIAVFIPRDRAYEWYLHDSHATAMLDLSDPSAETPWRPVACTTTHPLLDRLRAERDGGIILFTSGSTGRPKAVLHSAERFLHKFRKPGRRFRTLAFLLFDHVAGVDTMLYTLVSGGTLILTRRRDPRSIGALIESHLVEVLPTSPSFLRLFCATETAARQELPSVQIITYGSEPMDPSTLARLSARFPKVQLMQKYGTSETGSPRTISRGSDSLWLRFKSSDDFETRVVDGVLWIRTPGTLLGYLNAPSPVDENGWYCTADLVDVDGPWVRFRGRASDTINVGGEKVTPAEVEHTILELEFVREVVVSSAPHSLLGRIVTARVVIAPGTVDARKAVILIWQHCRARLAPYKAPASIEIVAGGLTDDRQKAKRQRVDATTGAAADRRLPEPQACPDTDRRTRP